MSDELEWPHSHEPKYKTLKRCEEDRMYGPPEEPWDHDPHEWFEEFPDEIVTSGAVVVRKQTVVWHDCPGRVSS